MSVNFFNFITNGIFQIACGRETDKSDPLKTCCWLNDLETENYRFAAGGIDSSLTVYQWSGNRDEKPFPIYSLRGHHGSIETLTTVDKNTLISAGQDRKIKIWKDFSTLGSESDDVSSKKRAKREQRGEVKTTGILKIYICKFFYFRVETFFHFLRISTSCISRLVSSLF